MLGSRSKRQARQRRRSRIRAFRITGGLAMALLLSVCAYWLWSGAAAERFSAGRVSAVDKPGGTAGSVSAAAPGSANGGPATTESEGGGQSGPGTESGGHTAEAAAEEAAAENGEGRVRLAFVGDIMMGGKVDQLLRKNGYAYPFLHVAEFLQAADIAAGNLENPITARGIAQDKQYVFRTSPDAVPELAASGLDLFTLANNHVLDYGVEGLQDTMALLEQAGLHYVGAGADEAEAYRPVIMEKNGVSIAYLGFSRVIPDVSWYARKNRPGLAGTYDYRKPTEAIAQAAEEADIVVVLVHWGIERMTLPEQYQQELGRRYIDAGADLVIGSHPHVLQGFEMYRGRWIAYSLGNFIFTVNPNPLTGQSAILEADCARGGECRLALRPVHTGVAQPYPMDAEESAAFFEHLTSLSYNAMVDGEGRIAEAEVPSSAWSAFWQNKKREEERP